MEEVVAVWGGGARAYAPGVPAAQVRAAFIVGMGCAECTVLDAATLTGVYDETLDAGVYSIVPKGQEERLQAACCRICRGGKEHGALFVPCACSGSIKFVHRKCLLAWVLRQGKNTCEVCGKSFVMAKLYTQQAPNIEDASILWSLAWNSAGRAARAGVGYTLQAAKWAVMTPLLVSLLFSLPLHLPLLKDSPLQQPAATPLLTVFSMITDGIGHFGIGLAVLCIRAVWVWAVNQHENWTQLACLKPYKVRALAARIDYENAALLLRQPWDGVDAVSAAAALCIAAASLRRPAAQFRFIADRAAIAPVLRHCRLPRLPRDLAEAAVAHAPVILYERCDLEGTSPDGVVCCEYSCYGRRGVTRGDALRDDESESSDDDGDAGELRRRVVRLPRCLLREAEPTGDAGSGDDAASTSPPRRLALELGGKVDSSNIQPTVEILAQKRARGEPVVDADGMLVVDKAQAPVVTAGGGFDHQHAETDDDGDAGRDLAALQRMMAGECLPVVQALAAQYVALVQLPSLMAAVLEAGVPSLGGLPAAARWGVAVVCFYRLVVPLAVMLVLPVADALASGTVGGSWRRARWVGTAACKVVADVEYAVQLHVALCYWTCHVLVDFVAVPILCGILVVALTRHLLFFDDIFGTAAPGDGDPALAARLSAGRWDHTSLDSRGYPFTPSTEMGYGLADLEYLASIFEPTTLGVVAALPTCHALPHLPEQPTPIRRVLASLLGSGDAPSDAAPEPNVSARVAGSGDASEPAEGEEPQQEPTPPPRTPRAGRTAGARSSRRVKLDFARGWELAADAAAAWGLPVDTWRDPPGALGTVDLGDGVLASCVDQVVTLARERVFGLWCAGVCVIGIAAALSSVTTGVKTRVYRRLLAKLPLSEFIAEDFSFMRWALSHTLREQCAVWGIMLFGAWLVALATVRAPLKAAAAIRPGQFPMQAINVAPAHLAADMLFVNVHVAFTGSLSALHGKVVKAFAAAMHATAEYLRLSTFLYGTDTEQAAAPPPPQLTLRLLTLCVMLWVAVAVTAVVCVAVPIVVGSAAMYIRPDMSALDCFLIGLCACICMPHAGVHIAHAAEQVYEASLKAFHSEHGLPDVIVTQPAVSPPAADPVAPPPLGAPADPAPAADEVMTREQIAAAAPPRSVIDAYSPPEDAEGAAASDAEGGESPGGSSGESEASAKEADSAPPQAQITEATLEAWRVKGGPRGSYVPPPEIMRKLRIVPATLFQAVVTAQKEGEGCSLLDAFKRGVAVNAAIAYTAVFLLKSGLFEVKRDRFGVVTAIEVRKFEDADGAPHAGGAVDRDVPLGPYEQEMLVLLKLMLGSPEDLLPRSDPPWTEREELDLCCQIWAQVLKLQEAGQQKRDRAGLTAVETVLYHAKRLLALAYPSLAMVTNWAVIVLVFGVILPMMTGLLMELSATMPASVTADQSPRLSLFATFVIGFVYFELWIRATVANPDFFAYNWKEHWAKLHRNGLKEADAWAAVVNLGVPAFSFLSAALCVPYVFHRLVLPVLAVHSPLAERIHHHRASHAISLFFVIVYKAGALAYNTLRPMLGRLCQNAYDESYLMGIWLEERKSEQPLL
eukprot:TRINITY_DN5624_c0_g1_i1.p1 TRINITY_DN5624_c0_g1~~TRINITY_DN5624_c0_g1_i1.p1  ORF type:complete len:1582 (+),score=481.58 TRINITY_DN5624_c0_g1_i1:165-4910(+)